MNRESQIRLGHLLPSPPALVSRPVQDNTKCEINVSQEPESKQSIRQNPD